MPKPEPNVVRDEWRALGVDHEGAHRVEEVISGPVANRSELDLGNDADPPYDEIIVQSRTVVETPWTDER